MIGISRLINGNKFLKETCQVCEIFIAKIVPMFHKMYLGADSKGVRFWTPRPEYIRPWQPLDMPMVCFFFFFSIWVLFHEHSQFTGQQGMGEGIYLTPLYHFHLPDISRAIMTESSPLHIASSRA